ncbi:hypothetical protein ALC57_04664 [Trachymyrmex cornetzi]|uniref:Uncharacterized protein n=1 Tax=Trachymyrmex cornetzi TaxID=471704 RepID=A0A195ECP5_9HYME|nr:hypothetical protein ALC57_04664 [Trachymyrmex cornetzi]
MSCTGLESSTLDESFSLIDHPGTTLHRSFTIMEREKRTFIFDPSTVPAELSEKQDRDKYVFIVIAYHPSPSINEKCFKR